MPLVPSATFKEVVAILCSDLHLSHKPPVARSAEKSWHQAMLRQLGELTRLSEQGVSYGTTHSGLPIICSGDVFDRWNPPVELVNFALMVLPHLYAVPGQHDLPMHNFEERNRSAFWSLVLAGRITPIHPGEPLQVTGSSVALNLHGFPWGFPCQPLTSAHDLVLEVAVVHAYTWLPGKGYPGAPQESRLHNCGKQFRGYDVVVIGDNHKPWLAKMGKTTIINVGGFYRRHTDEIDHHPSVGLLHSDGSVSRHYLDVSQDQFLPEEDLNHKTVMGVDIRPFVDAVDNLQRSVVDFEQEVRRYVEKDEIRPLVKKIILSTLEKNK